MAIMDTNVASSIDKHEQLDEDILGLGDSEPKKKTIAERLRGKIASMAKVKKGLTVDSGAADHVMPPG